MSQKARARVDGFGYLGLKDVRRVNSKTCLAIFSAKLQSPTSLDLINEAIDETIGIRLKSSHGEPTAMTLEVEIDVARYKNQVPSARATACDLIEKIEAKGLVSVPSARRNYKPARTLAQRGNLYR